MTSKIKVDNIENQCGGAVVTKCGATTTISGSVVKADDIQAADGGNLINQCGTTITLGASGDTISLASGASQSGFGRTGTVDWQTGSIKTTTFTAVNGEGYFVDTSGGAFTVNLPAGVAGAIVSVADYAATWQTNNLTVSPNGTDKIGSVNSDIILNTEGQSVTFVYVDSTQGWINTMDSTSNVRGNPNLTATVSGACNTLVTAPDCANVKIATFTGPGSFTVTNAAACAANNVVSYMVVAGGGSGGGNHAGGGGAGGFREYKSPVTPYTASPLDGNPGGTAVTVSAQAYSIVVGGGGAGISPACAPGNVGSNSTFGGIISTGGGGGGAQGQDALPGGSGGGGTYYGACGTAPHADGGTGNTPPVSPPQGQTGGTGYPQSQPYAGGGGGGAGAVGGPSQANGNNGGPGGNGVATSINSSSVTRAGGGGAGATQYGASAGTGGSGGGGAGATGPGATAGSGTVNTGSGGGGYYSGGAGGSSGSGGSGIVIIRYKFQ